MASSNTSSTIDSSYHVGGNLYLPDPKTCGLKGERLARIRKLQPLLEQLDARDLSQVPKTILDMDDAFSKFADSEVSIWTAHGDSVPSRDLLVRVSGSLQSPIAHHAHQPSFTTLQPRNGETADETNPCIAILMGNAFEKGKSLIYDHLLRRDEKSEGLQNYPEDVQQCHETYIQKVRESMEAKVEVIYGKPVKNRMLRKQAFKFDILRLWGEYDDICIFLDRESNYSNAQQGHQYRRVSVFVAHPQRFFYSPEGESVRQDKSLAVAAKISGINSIERYYEDQKWKAIVPPSFSILAKMKSFGIPSEQSQNDGGRSDTSSPVADGHWDSYFDGERPFSVQELRVILPATLAAATDPENNPHKWESPDDFPEIVGTWFGRQREILFKEMSISGAADIMAVYRRLCTIANGLLEENPSLAEAICGLIKEQARAIENLPTTALDDLLYYGFRPFDVVEAICESCRQPLSPDTKARWSVMRPGYYIIRNRRCNSDFCQGKLRRAIPRDKSILFAGNARGVLLIESVRNVRRGWRDGIRAPKDCEGKLSEPVESWCIRCTENTKLSDDRTRCVDKNPRWTVGDPPKYVERQPVCLNCRSEGRAGLRFIPVDVTIPSIYKRRLTTFEENFGNLDENMKAEALAVEPTSSRKPMAPAGPRPSRAKAPAKLKSLEANVPSKQEGSPTTAEEKQNGIVFRNAANATGPTHGKFANGVVPASDQSPALQRASADTLHQSNIRVTSKRPPMLISDLPFLPETKSGVKRQRIA